MVIYPAGGIPVDPFVFAGNCAILCAPVAVAAFAVVTGPTYLPQSTAHMATQATTPPAVLAPPAKDDLEFRALKILYGAGSNGVLQKHLFERLPPSMTAKRINMLAALQERGMAIKSTTSRHTSRWGYLWTLTAAGRTEYVKQLAARDLIAHPAPVG